jgi:hypothetical protein
MSLWSRITNVFRRDSLNLDIEEELQSHIAEAIEEGRDPSDAHRAFGSLLHHREKSRDIRLVPWLDSLRADAIFGWRQLMKRRSPPLPPFCLSASRSAHALRPSA